MEKHVPIRMCVLCRQRFEQKSMQRVYYKGSKFALNFGFGRSFYICQICQNAEFKQVRKSIKLKDMSINLQDLKEMIANAKD